MRPYTIEEAARIIASFRAAERAYRAGFDPREQMLVAKIAEALHADR